MVIHVIYLFYNIGLELLITAGKISKTIIIYHIDRFV